jgi:hypothetical protein
MNYIPVKIENLNIIQAEVMKLFPAENENQSTLFYIQNSVSEFLKIDLLREQLQRLGLIDNIVSIAFYNLHTTRPSGGALHIDHGESTFSLNLPIKNCDNTFVNFYTSSVEPEKRFNEANVPYYHIDAANSSLIDRIEMTQPYIINVKVPHNVVNPNRESRKTLLIRLKKECDAEYLSSLNFNSLPIKTPVNI